MPQRAVSVERVFRSSSLILPPLAVGDLRDQRADDVAQRRPGQVDDSAHWEVVDIVLRGLDVRLVLLDPEIDLGVDPGVEVVVVRYLLGRRRRPSSR